jgi:PAS domain S-box-containing protein
LPSSEFSSFAEFTRAWGEQRELPSGQELLRLLVEAVPHSVWMARPDGEVEYYNHRWFQETGLSPEQPEHWHPAVHPEDLSRVLDRWAHSVRTGEPYEVEARLRSADGTWRWYLGRALPLRDEQGRILRWFGTNSDIDDQKRAEGRTARLQAVTAALSEALTPSQVMDIIVTQGVSALEADAGLVALVDEQGTGLEVVSSTGYPRESVQQYRRMPLEAPLPLTESVRRDELILYSTSEERSRRFPRIAHLKMGFEASAVMPMRTSRGVVGALGVSFKAPRSLTATERDFCLALARQGAQALERARLYEAERRARAEAEASQARLHSLLQEQRRLEAEARRLADFEQEILGIVSHDLRNPLSVVRMSASLLLKQKGLDAGQSRTLWRIVSAADRATRLIHDLLDFSQVRLGGGIRVERRAMDLRDLARAVVDELLTAHPGRRVTLVLEGDGRGQWDADRLAQVLGNLLGNALQHSPADTQVRVGVLGMADLVQVEVHNQGPAINPELLPHLFEPFRRGNGSASRTGSVGLGLYITHQLVLAHGGTIEVESAPGQGTCFRLWLPRQEAQAEASP